MEILEYIVVAVVMGVISYMIWDSDDKVINRGDEWDQYIKELKGSGDTLSTGGNDGVHKITNDEYIEQRQIPPHTSIKTIGW